VSAREARPGVLLVGHGSRDRQGNAQFLVLAQALAGRRPGLAVEPCFLDHAEPSIQAGVDRLAARGVERAAAVPLFLFAAGHAKRDVPAQLARARERYPGLATGYGRPLGVHPVLAAACAHALASAEAAATAPATPARTVVLLVGRGSSDLEANDGLRAMADLVMAETGCGRVEHAYCDVARPGVEEGLERCVGLGARRVVLLPYFLFRGVLMERLRAMLETWRARAPGVDWLFAGEEGLGSWPPLLDLISARVDEALEA
jgi:sirohydrochlorin cobaltochelatase